MKRRSFITGATVASVAAASSFPKPAISQGIIEWRLATGWPKGFPGLGTGVQRIADSIERMSDGRLRIRLFAAGELVPPLQVFDGVSSGAADAGHDPSYWHIGKSNAFAFFTAIPFGLTAQEHNAWIHFGGGQELWDELYAEFGTKPFLAGNSSTQMLGWFRNEIKSVDDFQGLKFRMPGLGGRVLQRLGANTQTLPASEIFPALQSGALDGAEWVGPYNDIAIGFFKVAKYYYWPGFHEPGAALAFTVNKAAFDALPSDLQAIVEAASVAENDRIQAEFNWGSPGALRKLIQDEGVMLRQVPRDVLVRLGEESAALMQEVVDTGDPLTRKIADSYLRFRAGVKDWTQIADQGYANARLLPFGYPTSG